MPIYLLIPISLSLPSGLSSQAHALLLKYCGGDALASALIRSSGVWFGPGQLEGSWGVPVVAGGVGTGVWCRSASSTLFPWQPFMLLFHLSFLTSLFSPSCAQPFNNTSVYDDFLPGEQPGGGSVPWQGVALLASWCSTWRQSLAGHLCQPSAAPLLCSSWHCDARMQFSPLSSLFCQKPELLPPFECRLSRKEREMLVTFFFFLHLNTESKETKSKIRVYHRQQHLSKLIYCHSSNGP